MELLSLPYGFVGHELCNQKLACKSWPAKAGLQDFRRSRRPKKRPHGPNQSRLWAKTIESPFLVVVLKVKPL